MIRRLFWFCVGVVAGVYGTLQVRRAADGIAERLSLESVLRTAVSAIQFIVRTLTDAVRGRRREDARQTVV